MNSGLSATMYASAGFKVDNPLYTAENVISAHRTVIGSNWRVDSSRFPISCERGNAQDSDATDIESEFEFNDTLIQNTENTTATSSNKPQYHPSTTSFHTYRFSRAEVAALRPLPLNLLPEYHTELRAAPSRSPYVDEERTMIEHNDPFYIEARMRVEEWKRRAAERQNEEPEVTLPIVKDRRKPKERAQLSNKRVSNPSISASGPKPGPARSNKRKAAQMSLADGETSVMSASSTPQSLQEVELEPRKKLAKRSIQEKRQSSGKLTQDSIVTTVESAEQTKDKVVEKTDIEEKKSCQDGGPYQTTHTSDLQSDSSVRLSDLPRRSRIDAVHKYDSCGRTRASSVSKPSTSTVAIECSSITVAVEVNGNPSALLMSDPQVVDNLSAGGESEKGEHGRPKRIRRAPTSLYPSEPGVSFVRRNRTSKRKGARKL